MVGYHTSKDDEGEEIDLCKLIGVAIIKNSVQMTSGPNRSLIHYSLVHPDICDQHISTAMLKIITRQRDYVDRKTMAVTSLSNLYNGVVGFERFGAFLISFSFGL